MSESSAARETRIRELVAFLCSPACAGRAPGTPESRAARERIVAEFQAAGAEPAGSEGYLQAAPCGHNVLARIPGRGPLAERAVLVAAHYDHLGRAHGEQAYWGADDNAAAVAILCDLARQLAARPELLGRQVILAAFDGEEPPHFMDETMGSMHYVREPPRVPIAAHDMMICMDLCGHAVGPPAFPADVRQSLFVLGAELSEGTPELCDALAEAAPGVRPRRLGLDVIPPLSDYLAFQAREVPVLFLTCGRWEHYHQVTDTPEKLDYPKIVASADYLTALTRAQSVRPEVPVVFRAEGVDDAASLETILSIGRSLEALVPAIASFRPVGEALAAAAARGPLPPAEHRRIAQLVAGLESILA